MNLTPTKQFGILNVEEPELAVSEGADHERFELVHGDAHTLFLRNDELLAVLNVVHVPHFDLAVGG